MPYTVRTWQRVWYKTNQMINWVNDDLWPNWPIIACKLALIYTVVQAKAKATRNALVSKASQWKWEAKTIVLGIPKRNCTLQNTLSAAQVVHSTKQFYFWQSLQECCNHLFTHFQGGLCPLLWGLIERPNQINIQLVNASYERSYSTLNDCSLGEQRILFPLNLSVSLTKSRKHWDSRKTKFTFL